MELSTICWQLKRTLFTRLACVLGAALTLGLSVSQSTAFSLMGPAQDWMSRENGFRRLDDVGGPMYLGEEYRWNVPVVTYAFDQSFLNYFGAQGVAAVESAISVLNNLPPASQINPSNYPTAVTSLNIQAQSLGLIDLKSQTLSILLEQLGLASPSRFVFCVRGYTIGPMGEIEGEVPNLNYGPIYDPISFRPSAVVNDIPYGYSLHRLSSTSDPSVIVDALEYALVPDGLYNTAVADGVLAPGDLYTGLTRDDVGGLCYLLRTNNINWEALLPGVHGVGTNAEIYAKEVLRPGVDKITFVRRDFDSFLGQWVTPYTNQFIDTYVTNMTRVQQQLERVSTQPDFVFSAAAPDDAVGPRARVARTSASNWTASSFLLPGFAGPGLIQPAIRITFSKPSNLCVQTSDNWLGYYLHDLRWGSFDTSTNAPVVYPAGAAEQNSGQMTLSLRLDRPNAPLMEAGLWQVPVPVGQRALLQTSFDLKTWVTVTTVVNRGLPVEWDHQCSVTPQRYFRVVAE